tara:strand:+ start:285 stop:713 length:429 start_codon:yes stop_codon:yes gene_type:complete
MSKYMYAATAYETVEEVEAAVTSMKARLDNNPTDWCVVKPMINPRTIAIYTGDVIGYDSGEPLTDAQINALNPDEWLGGNGIYNVYSINSGDNFTEVSEAVAVQKVKTLRTYYARWLVVNRYFINETGAVMNVTNEDMSGYV